MECAFIGDMQQQQQQQQAPNNRTKEDGSVPIRRNPIRRNANPNPKL